MSSRADYALGVDLGTTYTCAAVAGDGAARVAQLTGTSQTIPSVVSKTDTGFLAGEAAERRLTSHPAETAREFKRRFGDPAPIVLGGATYGADALTAELLREVIARVETLEGAGPAAVALAHPASWGPFRLDLLRKAAAQAGVADVLLVPEPVAAAVANSDRVEDGSLVAVYDLGGGTFDAAVVRCAGDWSVVGTPEGVERLGGIDFDQAILAHVDQALDGQVYALDSSDPESRSALMQLRSECQSAKEHLSQDTDVDIPVSLPNVRTSVRLTRAEFESMVRPRLADSLSVLDRVVASADATWSDISVVLLVGGSSNIPAVGQLVAEHTGRPVVSATNPHLAIALGTATIAQRAVIRPAPAVDAAPVAASTSTRSMPATQPATTGAPKRGTPIGLIVAGIVAVIAAVGAFVVFGGGGSDGDTSETAAADSNVVSANDENAGEPTVDGTAQPAASVVEAQTTSPDESAPAATVAPESVEPVPAEPETTLVTIDVCATDAVDALRVGATDSGLYVVTASELRQVDSAAVTSCSIDVSAAPAVDLGQTEPVIDVSGFDNVVALSGARSGVIVNQATGNIEQCAVLTGPSGVDGDGSLMVLVGDAVQRLAVNRTGCAPDDSDAFADLAATSIAVGGSNRLALAGTSRSSGALELWVFNGPRNLTVLDGFGSIDGVDRCGDNWCVIDLAAAVVHLVGADGDHLGTAVLNAALPSTVAEVLDVTSTGEDGMLALVRLSDGSSTILRLKA